METTEKVVESYCRYVKGWLTIPNIRCPGQYEIDLLAADVSRKTVVKRYHIETSVSISRSFSQLTIDKFRPELLRQRVQVARQRRTIGYFIQRKFAADEVIDKLAEYGFRPSNYQKIIVTWDWKTEVEKEAAKAEILLWSFPELLQEIADWGLETRSYIADDTLRTLQLFAKSVSR